MISITKVLSKIRAVVVKRLFPSRLYFLGVRNVNPLSTKYGFDRGTPIDRYYIDKFLDSHKKYIKGACLEIVDNNYTNKFGKNILKSDILDNNEKNRRANIIADLQDLKKKIPSNTYDCVILTQTLGMIPDYQAAISEIYRILKKDGAFILTTAFISPNFRNNQSYWRFTPVGLRFILEKFFGKFEVDTFGNVLAAQCFWVGMAKEELNSNELDYQDRRYPVIVAALAIK